MVGWLDGWMVGWLDGWMVGWLDGWMVGWLDGWTVGWLDGYDGVQCFNSMGVLIGHIKLPEIGANLCFGREKRNRLFITASTSVYAFYWRLKVRTFVERWYGY
jgi:sugar lactone lactonase YvrE